MKTFGIYSAGGFSREIKHSVEKLYSENNKNAELLFVDDDPKRQNTIVNGVRVISYQEFCMKEDKVISVALASPLQRRKIVQKCINDGIGFYDIFSHTYVGGENVSIGEGAIFAHNTLVTSDATIGRHFHCNIYSYVAHDCVIGDFVTFAPRVSLNGRIRVCDLVYVGSDATFLPGKEDDFIIIGEGAVVGAGAVVTKHVEPGAVVVGNPARQIKSRIEV